MNITSREEFDRLLHALGSELMWANATYELFLQINASFVEYQNEVNQSRVFWGITRDAIKEKATLALCRIYDNDHRTNSLPNLLREIRENAQLAGVISDEDGNAKILDRQQLDEDIEFVSRGPSVKRVIRWRSLSFAHKNAARVATNRPLRKEELPLYSDFETLLKAGLQIINRYAGHFKSAEYSTILPAGDDFKFVLESVRENLKLRRKQHAEEVRSYGLDPKELGLED
jgi:hypothetical protein